MPEFVKTLVSHQLVNDCNRNLTIGVVDKPGTAGASSVFQILGFDTGTHPANKPAADSCLLPLDADHDRCTLIFQNGNPNDPAIGNNGVTNESLLAVLAARFTGFQSGPFACDANERVLTRLNECLKILAERSAERIARNVEGLQTP